MTFFIKIVLLFALASAHGQTVFDSVQLEKKLVALPKSERKFTGNPDILKAIEAVDKNYRKIADSLYQYKSHQFTILEAISIETDNGTINPLDFGENLKTTAIVFNHSDLNPMVLRLAKRLPPKERSKLYQFLEHNLDYFDTKDKTVHAKSVRIKTIKAATDSIMAIGIDVYGAHFLWSFDKKQDWKLVKVERLWTY